MLALGLLILALASPSLLAAPAAGQILFSKGSLQIVHQGQLQTASRGSQVWPGDTLITGHNSRALLRFSDGTRTTLGDDTEYRIENFSLNVQGQSRATYQLVKGVFKTVTGAIAKDGPDIKDKPLVVLTPLGTLGIRGTTFWGGYLEPGKIDVLLIAGDHAVEVSNAIGSRLLTTAGEGTTLTAGSAPGTVKTWPEAKVKRATATVSWPELPEALH
ncbi:MAG: hypothetical protein AseanaTS_02670 [Candidatus Pelagadaptatus aseana]